MQTTLTLSGLIHNVANQARVAEILVQTLVNNNVDPDETYTAAAGANYGQVDVWHLGRNGGYLVAYGDNGQTDYELADDQPDCLGEYLIGDDLAGLDCVIAHANVYGLDGLDGADKSGDDPVSVLIQRSYHDGTQPTDAVRDDTMDPMEFDSYGEAEDWIDAEDEEPYHLAHNETGRPTYKVVAL